MGAGIEHARRYRFNAADCLLAAKACQSENRSLVLSVAAAWYALAPGGDDRDIRDAQ
jgi:hypothetical protein